LISKKKFISLTLLIVVIYFLFDFIEENKNILENFDNISFSIFLFFLLLNLFNMIARAYMNIYLFKCTEISLGYLEAFELVFKNTVGNLLGPFKAGSGYKLHYLNKNYKLSPSKFISVNTAYSLVSLTISIFIIFAALLILNNISNINTLSVLMIFISLIVFLFIFLRLLLLIEKKISVKTISNFASGFRSIFNHKKNFFKLSLITFLIIFLNIIIIFCAFRFFEFNISFINSVIYSSIGSLSTIAKITPGNIGVYEFLMISSIAFHGVQIEQVLISSIFIRSVSYILYLIIYIFLSIKTLTNRT